MTNLILGIIIGIISVFIFIVYSFIIMRMGYMSGCKDWKLVKKYFEEGERVK